MKIFKEELYPDYKQNIKIKSIIANKKSKFQNILIFDSQIFGKVLSLDNIIQITEHDHYGYTEMLTHVPIMAHGNTKKVLVRRRRWSHKTLRV